MTDDDTRSDMNIGNTYRLEYIRHLVSVAIAVLIFSITFMKDILGQGDNEAEFKIFLAAGWLSLVVSVVFGIFHMRNLANFYISWSLRSENKKGVSERKELLDYQKNMATTHIFTFLAGLVLILIFAIKNLNL